jgi:ArsR family transcriptional regulator, lead/cadmium/zinc/bismuth-responsive transcriptional repressor
MTRTPAPKGGSDGRTTLPILGPLQVPPLATREPMGAHEAAGIAAVFKVLANDTRLRLLHALVREGEVRVSDLAAQVGMTQQAVSNQLQRLVDRRIVAARRDGNNIYYRIVDACVPALLELGWCLLDTTSAHTG